MHICNFYKKLKMNDLCFVDSSCVVNEWCENIAKRNKMCLVDIIQLCDRNKI